MTKNLLSVIRELNEFIKDAEVGNDTIDTICSELRDFVGASVVVVDIMGKKIVTEFYGNQTIFPAKEDVDCIDSQLNDQLKNIVEHRVNTSLSNFYFKHVTKAELNKYSSIIVPLSASKERLGTLILFKEKNKFDEDEICLVEVCVMFLSLVLKHSRQEESAEEKRRMNIVKSAISTLSYSELEAILHIFQELDGTEGLLVASKIADRVGITRSVIVNALRKFESAGVIESRSLGMKGTYLKVLNDLLIVELNKLRS